MMFVGVDPGGVHVAGNERRLAPTPVLRKASRSATSVP
jgi:hypothetical protein